MHGWLQTVRVLKDTHLRERLSIGGIGSYALFLLGFRQLGPTSFVHLQHQKILHTNPLPIVCGCILFCHYYDV
jgi:hypothetical protein